MTESQSSGLALTGVRGLALNIFLLQRAWFVIHQWIPGQFVDQEVNERGDA